MLTFKLYRAALAASVVVVSMAACSGEVGTLPGDEILVPANGGPAVGATNEPGNGVVLTHGGPGTSGAGGGPEELVSNGGGRAVVARGNGSGSGEAGGNAGGSAGGEGGGSAGGTAGGSAGGEAGGGSAGGAAGGGTPAVVAFTPGPQGCSPIGVEAGVSVGGYLSDRFSWKDSACRPRTAALVRNNAQDPGGSYGGYLRELTWELNGSTVTARGTNTNTYNGWGYVVNHYGSTSDSSKRHSGTYRTVFAGQHHAIHEFKVRNNTGGPLDATVHWFFASGRSAPVYFITYDASSAGANVISADSRAPYGDMAFEGASGPIGGVAWGDRYKFTTTTTSPVLASSAWDYTQPNTIPFVRMWSQNVDAEMGAVQTQTWDQFPSGGDYGAGIRDCVGKTSTNDGSGCTGSSGWTMPQSFLWPFQLNQYELPYTSSSHRLAWGTTYGAIGKTSVTTFGKAHSGYPTVSYSVMLTIGPKSQGTTMAQVTQVERMVAAQVTGGTYDPSFGVWRVPMSGNRGDVTLTPAGGAVEKPIFRFTGFTGAAPTQVKLDGQLTSNYFASVDAATQTLWLTLNGTVTGPVAIHVE